MLDGMSLSDKLRVAREWFRRSRSGEFDFEDRHADTFVALLEDCEFGAAVLEANTTIMSARLALIDGGQALPTDALLHGAGGNVVSLAAARRRPGGGR